MVVSLADLLAARWALKKVVKWAALRAGMLAAHLVASWEYLMVDN